MADFKQCPACGVHHPPTHAFCPLCGESLQHTTVQSQYGGGQEHYWEIPDFLLEASKWQRTRDNGASGSGLLWIGGLLALVPFLIEPERPLAMAAFGAGLLIIIGGLLRMRSSARTLARAGMLANGAALLALALVVGRIVITPIGTGTPTPDGTAIVVGEAETVAIHGGAVAPDTVAMFRGDPAHTGVLDAVAPTGNPVIDWRYDASGEITSSAAVAEGLVFFTGKQGDLFAIAADTGQIRWQQHLGDYTLGSSPAVVDGAVYVAGGFMLYSFEAQSGKERWRLPIQYAAQSSPTIDGELLFLASQDGKVYGVDTATGQQRWGTVVNKGLVFGSPAVADGMVFVGTDAGQVVALGEESGIRLWSVALGGTIIGSPAISGSTLIVASRAGGSEDAQTPTAIPGGGVTALDLATGKIKWSYGVASASSAAIAGNLVIIGGDDGGVHALDLATGEQRWLTPTGNPVSSSPVVLDQRVYIASGLHLYQLDLDTGAAIWRFSTTDAIAASPAIADGRIYLGSLDGFLYAIGGDGRT